MEVIGINIDDDRLKPIKEIIENCYKLNIAFPNGLSEKVRELGHELDLEAGGRENPIIFRVALDLYERKYFNICEYSTEDGYDIDLSDIPDTVKTLRIPNI